MVKIFPSALERSPDLFNLEVIHQEARDIENIVIDKRLNGLRDATINTTAFTDTTIASNITFDTPVTGTADFATNTETTVTPGDILQYNEQNIIYEVQLDGTQTWADTNSTIIITVNGNLVIGGTGTFSVALNTTMTLDDAVVAINAEIANTGVRATARLNASVYNLRLTKDNTTNGNPLVIDATSTASILTDLGLVSGSNVIDIVDVAAQTPDGSVAGAGPFNLAITDADGVYVRGGTSITTLGLTKSINLTTNALTFTAHAFINGQQVELVPTGSLPTPLEAFPSSFYYVIVVDVNTIKLALTNSDALNNVAIDIIADGNNVFKVKTLNDSEVYYSVWQGFSENTVFKQRMDQVIAYFVEKQYVIFRQTNPSTEATFQWVVKW